MRKIYIVPIEPLENRYTKEWYDHLPTTIDSFLTKNNAKKDIVVVDGEKTNSSATNGAFLNFASTNIYKSSQLSAIAHEFNYNKVSPGDIFVFTDAWNPSVITLKYMSQLCQIPVTIHGLWHAGSYDQHDFLGRISGDPAWIRTSEKAMFECYDRNWFATNFHINLFMAGLFENQQELKDYFIQTKKISQTGWPITYLEKSLEPYRRMNKKNQIVFPHRIAPEKQVDIFNDLAKSMPQYDWVICQDKIRSKEEYHKILGESKVVFSANLQETLGISMIEGLICQCAPLVPDRLSYKEMYLDQFKYPSEWTLSYDNYLANKEKIMARITQLMNSSRDVAWRFGNIGVQYDKLNSYVFPLPFLNSLI